MRFLSNAHTHTPYCDGQSSIQETLRAAKRLGFVSLGFSGHGDQGFDPDYSMTDGRQERYEKELRTLQKELLERGEFPRLWVGVEEDSLTPEARRQANRRELDYVIGSAHYLEREWEGEPVAVDGDPELLSAYLRRELGGDGLEMARRYFHAHVSALLRDPPDIIGHFDLVRRYAEQRKFFDPQSPAYRALALEALEKALPCGGVLEVNTGGMARGKITTPYPTEELLGAWREMGGRVTLTSDCHQAEKLDYGFSETLRLLARLGYRYVYRLGRGPALWEEERLALLRG